MRVLIVNTSERTGGAAVAAGRLLEALINNGVKAKMTASFAADGRLKITGSVLLISESVYWNKIN